jgi:hypothetical protein
MRRITMRNFAVALLFALVANPAAAAVQDTVRFTPTVGHPTFAVRYPVLRIKPGTVLISNTNFGAYYEEGGGAFPGEAGPFYIEGAAPGDVLVVEILRVRPNHSLAGSQIYSDFGGLATDSRLRLLNEPIPPRRYEWRLDLTDMTGTTELPGGGDCRRTLPDPASSTRRPSWCNRAAAVRTLSPVRSGRVSLTGRS